MNVYLLLYHAKTTPSDHGDAPYYGTWRGGSNRTEEKKKNCNVTDNSYVYSYKFP